MANPHRPYLEFANSAAALKEVIRFQGQYGFRDYPQPDRYESSADHTWQLILLLMLFEKRLSRPTDLERALKLAVIHDLPEAVAGDEPAHGKDGRGRTREEEEDKRRREETGAARLFGILPQAEAKELHDLWEEYERQESFEAQVVRALDKIEGKLQALRYSDGVFYPEHYEFTLSYGVAECEVDPALSEFMGLVVEEVKRKYRRFDGSQALDYGG